MKKILTRVGRGVWWVITVFQNENGGKPRLSFSKLVTAVFVVDVVGHDHTDPWVLLILTCAAFGRHTIERLIDSGAFKRTDSLTKSITVDAAEVIKAMREPNARKDDERG